MDKDVAQLQETIAFLQADLQQMSDEIYAQQKEITALRLKMGLLEDKVKHLDNQGGILRPEEDSPPPHY